MPLVDPPSSLICDHCLVLPDELAEAYGGELCARGLFASAMTKPASATSLIGGASPQEALNHFTYSFSTSAVRGQYLLLDGNNLLSDVPAEILVSLSSEKVAYLDLAAGAGAGTFGLLCTLAVLRKLNLVPTPPVSIQVLAADISGTALELYSRLYTSLNPFFAGSGLKVTCDTQVWDGTKSNETSLLMDRWFQSNPHATEHFAVISALSGGGIGLAGRIQRSIQHISDRLANYRSTFLLLEPSMKGTHAFVQKLLDALHLGWFVSRTGPGLFGGYEWWHPFTGNRINGSIWIRHYKKV